MYIVHPIVLSTCLLYLKKKGYGGSRIFRRAIQEALQKHIEHGILPAPELLEHSHDKRGETVA